MMVKQVGASSNYNWFKMNEGLDGEIVYQIDDPQEPNIAKKL